MVHIHISGLCILKLVCSDELSTLALLLIRPPRSKASESNQLQFLDSLQLNLTRAPLDAFSLSHNHIKLYQTMTKWRKESISTLRGSTEGSFVRKVWNWLQMVVHRLLGESMGRASMKVAMFSRQCSIVPPAGRLFLLFKPWSAQSHKPLQGYIMKFYKRRYFHLTDHSVLINHNAHDGRDLGH